MYHRGKFDHNVELQKFSKKIEKACIDTVTSGIMTKDLALLIGNDTKWSNTKEFIQKVKEKIN